MLVLTRGLKQSIEIGLQTVTITVLDVKQGRVRLGIDAPASVVIRRGNLAEQDNGSGVRLHAHVQ